MALSLEEFRSSLRDSGSRQALGLPLTDADAQLVAADPQAAQSWYEYWQSMNPQMAPAAPALPATASSPAETVPLGGHDFAQTAAFAAAPPAFGGTPPGTAPYAAAPGAPSVGAPHPGEPQKKSRVGLWVTLSIVGALLLIAIIVVVVAFTTARHWTKVDSPEKPETFHSEEYETGLYLVSDDGVSPCAVDQDWTDCITAMEAQYAGACAGVELVPAAATICAQHRAEIDRMRAADSEGSVVASLGDFGHLTRTPETATRQVSNNDYEAAVTHEAVCYLGFLGECE
ncbi:hypothetical protein ACFVWL_14865 [Microbacterium sp. NPDC058269]|jgi:hypothetical protein|uniref:hypothetical protein n=1 Tax=Microbacterium sp. NPDC058269 TaxID=3346414 RepID=UPI0036D86FCD